VDKTLPLSVSSPVGTNLLNRLLKTQLPDPHTTNSLSWKFRTILLDKDIVLPDKAS
jgi:hypothetical protein